MVPRRVIFVVMLCLCAASVAATTAPTSTAVSLPQYIAELDTLLAATADVEANPANAAAVADALPTAWLVSTDTKTFEISADPLRRDLHAIAKNGKDATLAGLRSRLNFMRSQAADFLQPAQEVSRERARLTDILARREFRRVHGPTWWDRLQRRITEALLNLLQRLFGFSAVRTIGKGFVWTVIAVAVIVLAIWIYRILKRGAPQKSMAPGTEPVSAKQWAVWLAEARAAADRGAWRDAVHLAYWAGISFLEERGVWRPDRARTPREYLRLVPQESEQRPALASLTRQFETVWYGYRQAGPEAFTETVAQLEKLGCR